VDGQGGGDIPVVLELGDNYSNPFYPTTTIRFGMPLKDRVLLEVLNASGRLVK
jgi:hypothetical protein